MMLTNVNGWIQGERTVCRERVVAGSHVHRAIELVSRAPGEMLHPQAGAGAWLNEMQRKDESRWA
ncbi:MAG: hypothetical protein HY694_04835 [Deltaproteobacteria bacterium]|nr:hypothetical protein [Deltaproteobacteria bacterium]